MCDYDVANKSNQKNTTKLIKLTDSMNNDMVTYSRSVQVIYNNIIISYIF